MNIRRNFIFSAAKLNEHSPETSENTQQQSTALRSQFRRKASYHKLYYFLKQVLLKLKTKY